MIITNREEYDQALKVLRRAKTVYFDTETSGLKAFKGDRLCGIGIGISPTQVWYFPFRHIGDFYEDDNLPEEWIPDLIKVLSQAPVLVGYNIKFDLRMIAFEGYEPTETQKMVCVKVMARLCVPEKHPPGGMTLQNMSNRFLKTGKGDYNDKLKEWMRAHKLWVDSTKTRLFNHVPVSQLGPYCVDDVICTMELRKEFQGQIKKTGQVRVWYNEVNVTRVFFEMEWRGVRVDLEYCKQAIGVIEERLEAIKEEMIVLTGTWFNLNSNPQITIAMNAIGVFSPILTKGGKDGKNKQQGWGKEALAEMGQDAHPAVRLIREYKQLESLKNTYFQVFLDTGGFLHGTFNQDGTITGRVSCSDPNLQNIPALVQKIEEEGLAVDLHQSVLSALGIDSSRFMAVTTAHDADSWEENDGSAVAARRAIIPREGYVFLKADYSQMEMLAFVCYINNKTLIAQIEKSYQEYQPFDYHDMVTYEVWGVSKEDPDYKIFRKMAKGINFGLIFGIGKKKLAKNLGVDIDAAEQYKEEYFHKIVGARAFIHRVQNTVEARGYVNNLFGRRYFLDKTKAYVGVNYLDQGSCADMMKERMWELRIALLESELDASIVLQIHDELVVEVMEEQATQAAVIVKQVMEKKVFSIPFRVDVELCNESWIKGDKFDARELEAMGVAA